MMVVQGLRGASFRFGLLLGLKEASDQMEQWIISWTLSLFTHI